MIKIIMVKNKTQKSAKTSFPTDNLGATTLPHIRGSFMYIVTSQNNSGSENVFLFFERTDIIQSINTSFYYNRVSSLTNDSLKSVGRFWTKLLLSDKTWSTR